MAWACARTLAEDIRAFTLFATHYFELTELASLSSTMENVHMDAKEHADTLVFLYKVEKGPANKSYGIQVAKLAGLPQSTLAIAQEKLQSLEKQSLQNTPQAFKNQPVQSASKNTKEPVHV